MLVSADWLAVDGAGQSFRELTGWDPAGPCRPGHPLRDVGFSACTHAARMALAPQEHAAYLREIGAFRRIALGKPLVPSRP